MKSSIVICMSLVFGLIALITVQGHRPPALTAEMGWNAGPADVINISLVNKAFVPAAATVKDSDAIKVCNGDRVFHSPFSYSTYNKFGSPKGILIRPGECFTHVVRNPTNESICVKLFDEMHSFEKLQLTVLPSSGNASGRPCEKDEKEGPVSTGIAGKWTFNNWTYEIEETGPTTFKWKITNDDAYGENADGEYLPNHRIKATWRNKNGKDTGGAKIVYDEHGRAILLKWDNGAEFRRKNN